MKLIAILPHVCLFAALDACSTDAGAPTLDEEPMTTSPSPQPPAVSWTVRYADGSGNVTTLSGDGPGEEIRIDYAPVTPEASSSGSYSGGTPCQGIVPGDEVEELKRRLEQLEADAARHTEARAMGTGRFEVTDRGGERTFIVLPGSTLTGLDELIARVRVAACPPPAPG